MGGRGAVRAFGFLLVAATAAEAQVTEMPAPELAAAIRAGDIKAVEAVEAALAAAEAKAGLNALITINADGARTAAAEVDRRIARGEPVGALAGVPLVVKDNILTAGLKTTAGTLGLRDFVPTANAIVLQPLLDAGAIIVGKANMHELAFGITSNNAAFGAVGNAAAPDRFAGGSSGGTAAAIAAGIVPAGLGTDTGGSMRIPAALNGVVGFRPTAGRYPQGGIVPLSATRDTAGPMARTMAGIVLLDGVITGEDGPLRAPDASALRIGVAAPLDQNLSPGVAAAFDGALARLEAEGVTLVPVNLTELVTLNMEASFAIVLHEARRDLALFLAEFVPGTTLDALAADIASPDVRGVFETAILGENAMPEDAYRRALDETRPQMQELYNALMEAEGLDAIAFPTTPLEAQPIAGSDETVMLNGEAVPTFAIFIRNTDVGSVLGVPGLSLPMGTTPEGLPVGLELDGRAFADRDLLAVGLALEGLVRP